MSRRSRLGYFPLAGPLLLAFMGLIIVVMALVELQVMAYAYERIGLESKYFFTFLLLSLLGSYVNIPVKVLPTEELLSGQIVSFFGVQYIVPVVEEVGQTVIAINVGGALIPMAISAYLMAHNSIYFDCILAAVVVTLITFWFARPVEGVGIVVPTLIPPVVAAIAAWLFATHAIPAVAYTAGTLGTLVGADILNLGRIRGLKAPVASIGGAGTFDGIFLTGLLAALLA
jgi:uncharacterized membrane protein